MSRQQLRFLPGDWVLVIGNCAAAGHACRVAGYALPSRYPGADYLIRCPHLEISRYRHGYIAVADEDLMPLIGNAREFRREQWMGS